MAEISRDPLELVSQTISEHQYPDGFVLFLGTLFAPTQDRDDQGRGFTHKEGDVVAISTPKLGVLENRVTTCTGRAARGPSASARLMATSRGAGCSGEHTARSIRA